MKTQIPDVPPTPAERAEMIASYEQDMAINAMMENATRKAQEERGAIMAAELEADQRKQYSRYVSDGYGDSDGYFAPLMFDQWVRTFYQPTPPAPTREELEEDAYRKFCELAEAWERAQRACFRREEHEAHARAYDAYHAACALAPLPDDQNGYLTHSQVHRDRFDRELQEKRAANEQ